MSEERKYAYIVKSNIEQKILPSGWLYRFEGRNPVFMLERQNWAENNTKWTETAVYEL